MSGFILILPFSFNNTLFNPRQKFVFASFIVSAHYNAKWKKGYLNMVYQCLANNDIYQMVSVHKIFLLIQRYQNFFNSIQLKIFSIEFFSTLIPDAMEPTKFIHKINQGTDSTLFSSQWQSKIIVETEYLYNIVDENRNTWL